ncbi:hypothetical protein B0J13DRAFT_669926 [Dactylonectria estremocensis]|uniref:BTB domain-containing protein n=1 Tax=Dactylonectria estremocensis TaxID=1079267 RepID=A0A9P9FM02_9HYPO|nr:hypothetical protein B0J13DRAFT_669926 [Dactylonectria estremocensis]
MAATRRRGARAEETRPPSSTGFDYRDGDDTVEDLRSIPVYKSLSTLRLSSKFSDMTIRCGGREFKAHRAIVCTQSSFFEVAFSGEFKEAASQVIDPPEDDPDVLDRFLEFLYTGTYSQGTRYPINTPSTVAMMSTEAIQKSLKRPPGVICQDKTSEYAESQTASGDEEEAEEEFEEDPDFPQDPEDPEDPEYWPPNRDRKEPNEEYNEFGGDDASVEKDDNEDKYQVQNEQLEFNHGSSAVKSTEEIIRERKRVLRKLAKERNDLFMPLRIYVMADKYDVPLLRLLARDRFYRAAELLWEDAECFPDVVDELYRLTPETDTAMREIVCRLVGNRVNESPIRDKMRAVMREHGDFTVGVMEYMLHFNKNW